MYFATCRALGKISEKVCRSREPLAEATVYSSADGMAYGCRPVRDFWWNQRKSRKTRLGR
jgi:hypothetical protein